MISVTLTANGNAVTKKIRNTAAVTISGTYGGGTAKIQVCNTESGTYIDVDNGDFTSGSNAKIVNWAGFVRVNLAGSTTPSLLVTLELPSEV
tara:strand:- start:174 stop:449 length:276 start_codon:yes stop_codon:yes gene_type:complete